MTPLDPIMTRFPPFTIRADFTLPPVLIVNQTSFRRFAASITRWIRLLNNRRTIQIPGIAIA